VKVLFCTGAQLSFGCSALTSTVQLAAPNCRR